MRNFAIGSLVFLAAIFFNKTGAMRKVNIEVSTSTRVPEWRHE